MQWAARFRRVAFFVWMILNRRKVADMIVRTLNDVLGSPQHVVGEGFESRRILLKPDGLGYSFHDTIVEEGHEMRIEFKNHVETNYCIAGKGEVVDLMTDTVYPIAPGTIYVLDNHEPHMLRATEGTLRLVCVFTPALSGTEIHDEDGSYALDLD